MEFHINQDVVCVDASATVGLKKGSTYKVEGISKCPSCQQIKLNISGVVLPPKYKGSECDCGHTRKETTYIYRASRFRPLDELVQINEVHEVLKQPVFQ